MPNRSSCARALSAVLTLLGSITAAADPRGDEADRLFQQGRQLAAAGRLAEACAAFDTSQQLSPATTTLFNQADCREKANQLATAYRLFAEAERQTRTATDEVGLRLHRVAVDRVARLAPRVSQLTIAVPDPTEGLIVLRDNQVVAPADWNRPQPIDGGSYVLVAKLGDREVWRESIAIAHEEAKTTVQVSRSVHEARTPAIVTPVQVAPPRSRRSALLATVGTGLLLGGALGLELWGSSTYARAVATGDESLRGSANTRRYAAQGLLGAGIATAGVAAWLWLRGGTERPRTARHSSRIDPIVGAGIVGLQLGRSW
jgi:hypothetical protein